MESEFSYNCRKLAGLFIELADAHDKGMAALNNRVSHLESEANKNYETKKKIFAVLQEDLNGI